MTKVRLLKDIDAGKTGDIINVEKKGAAHLIEIGYAEIIPNDLSPEEKYYKDKEQKERYIQQVKWVADKEMQERHQWIGWKYKPDNKGKLPINPKTKSAASSTDKTTWGTIDQALSFYIKNNNIAGVGYVFTKDDPFTGMDWDKSITNNKANDRVEKELQFLNSYTEYSPSHTGLHTIVKAKKKGMECKTKDHFVEVYDEKRFFTFTGEVYKDYKQIRECQEELDQFCERLLPEEKITTTPTERKPINITDEELITKAMNATNGDKFKKLWDGDISGYDSQSEADLALCGYLGFWTGGDRIRIEQLFEQSSLCRDKWKKRKNYRESTINKALSGKTEFYEQHEEEKTSSEPTTSTTKIQTREELYESLRKWLYLPDTNRVDIILATYLSTFDNGKPLWLFIVGGSGDCKSELLNTLDGRPGVRKVDQLTANTLASGRMRTVQKNNGDKKEIQTKDLGSELQGKKTLLMFTDLACLTSLNKDEKKKIWSQFRTLYDGEIFKDTGSGAQRKYTDCHVNILAAVTSAIKEEYAVNQQLGTREILYDTEPDPRDNQEKMIWSLKHCGKESEMKQELKASVDGFLLDKTYNPSIEIPSDILHYIFAECEKLRVLRATGKTDWKTGEVDGDFEAEVTTRLVQQLAKLYRALHSLDPEYPDENFKQIVERMVKSSSDPIRYKLYYFFPKHLNEWFSAYDLHLQFKNSRIALSSQCEAMWNMGLIEKRMDDEQIGGHLSVDYEGRESLRGGRWDRVAKYSCSKDYRSLILEDFI